MDVQGLGSSSGSVRYVQPQAGIARQEGASLSVSISGQLETEKGNAAFSVDISASATHGEAVKGLSADQVQALKDNLASSYQVMLKTLTAQNAKMQGWLESGLSSVGGVDFSKFALPAVGTTPEEAAAAIGEDGDYSVAKVADRIFGLATAIAGDDSGKLQQMQDAVKKGFEQAGLDWSQMTGQSKMPQITQDTYDEIARRFDEQYKKLGAAPAEGAQ